MRVVKGFLMVVGAGAVILGMLWLVTGHEDQPAQPQTNSASADPAPSPTPDQIGKPHKGCVLKAGAGAVCSSGLAAVIAFQRYGDDAKTMRQSYASTVLQQAGCFVITDGGPPIQQMNHGRVALSDGWAPVTTVVVGPGAGVIADAFLDGICEPFKVPPPTVLKMESTMPDYSLSSDGKSDKVEVTGGAATPPPSDSDNSEPSARDESSR